VRQACATVPACQEWKKRLTRFHFAPPAIVQPGGSSASQRSPPPSPARRKASPHPLRAAPRSSSARIPGRSNAPRSIARYAANGPTDPTGPTRAPAAPAVMRPWSVIARGSARPEYCLYAPGLQSEPHDHAREPSVGSRCWDLPKGIDRDSRSLFSLYALTERCWEYPAVIDVH
jgi:hypothetical protein